MEKRSVEEVIRENVFGAVSACTGQISSDYEFLEKDEAFLDELAEVLSPLQFDEIITTTVENIISELNLEEHKELFLDVFRNKLKEASDGTVK